MTEDKGRGVDEKAVPVHLGEIFSLINMTDLPAMSPHVQELIALAYDSRAGSDQLAEVILKDYSLTNKVLQLVNSAYYGLSQKVSSISRAVTIIGFEAIRNMACGVAIFEDFVKSGVERDGISELMTRSFLSGLWARALCAEKGLKVQPEETFIASLLHDLGRVIVCIYLPEVYNRIRDGLGRGLSDNEAEWLALGEINLAEIGQEVARFWNMSDKIISSMEVAPPLPETTYDEAGITRSLADFSNRFTGLVCSQGPMEELFFEYGPFFSISQSGAVKLMLSCVDESAGFSRAVSHGLGRLKVRARLVALQEALKAGGPAVGNGLGSGGGISGGRPGIADEITGLVRRTGTNIFGKFDLKEFFQSLVNGLSGTIGFDRAVVGLVGGGDDGPTLLCRFYAGGADKAFARLLESEFGRGRGLVFDACNSGKEVVSPPEGGRGFSSQFTALVEGRRVYILPVAWRKGTAALIYLDLAGPPPGERRFNALKALRQYSEMAIKKYRANVGQE